MTKTKIYNPLISIVIPTHNRPQLLQKAIDSVFNQTYPSIEIIVVDDASSIETQNILNNYIRTHSNIKILRNEVSQGPCRSRNMGIYAAQGELISFLDDDDEWIRERLEILVNSHDPEYTYICSDYWVKSENGFDLKRLPRTITFQDMLYRNRTGNTVLVQTKRVRAIGGFDEKLEARQDYDLWLRLLEDSSNKMAQVVFQPLHIVNKMSHERLTSSYKAYLGQRSFFLKHRKKMNHWQRRFQTVKLLKLRNKRLVWKDHLCNWIVRKRLNYLPSRKVLHI